jgi:hypothetical protein
MHDGLRRARNQAILTLAVGAMMALLFACGIRGRRSGFAHGPFAFSEYQVLDWIGMTAGLLTVVASLYRAVTVHRALCATAAAQDARFFARAGLACQLYELLLGVAAVDGTIADAKRAMISRLLLSELPERVLPQDLASWARRITVPRDPQQVARQVAPLLNSFERDLLLEWCRVVGLADGHMDGQENELLGLIAATLRQG